MVIEVTPHARDNFNDLARLTIAHENGKLTTPVRMVNRNDLNAKNKSGADIPLMRNSHAFMFQEKINPDKLGSIMNENGYLHKMRMTGLEVLNKVGNENLKLFYASLTRESMLELIYYNERQKRSLVHFLCNAARAIGVGSIVLPVIYDDLHALAKQVSEMGLQLIPSLDMTVSTNDFQKRIDTCMEIGSNVIPLLAMYFATYPKANQAYEYLRSKFDNLHEKNQAIITVDAQRTMWTKEYKSVSGSHYGAFLTADLSVEIYSRGSGGDRNLRIYSKDNLSLPKTAGGVSFDPDVEKTVFENDPHLQELFVRAATNKTTTADWDQGLPKYVVRIHEAVRSHSEFDNLSRSIKNNSARDYLREKPTMNEVITKDLNL